MSAPDEHRAWDGPAERVTIKLRPIGAATTLPEQAEEAVDAAGVRAQL